MPRLHGPYRRRRLHFGVEDKKLAAVWEYPTSPLYTIAERARLDYALAAASVPNAVTDAMFAELRKYWTEEQIVEIVGVIALFGFLNRWNDTMATPLEDEPIEVAERSISHAMAGKLGNTAVDVPQLAFRIRHNIQFARRDCERVSAGGRC